MQTIHSQPSSSSIESYVTDNMSATVLKSEATFYTKKRHYYEFTLNKVTVMTSKCIGPPAQLFGPSSVD